MKSESFFVYRTEHHNKKHFSRILNLVLNPVFCIFIPVVTILTTEWIARGTLGNDTKSLTFIEALLANTESFIITYLLLLFIYITLLFLTGRHLPAILTVGLFSNLIGIATYFKLEMRNEPLLPWDLYQIGELVSIMGEVELNVSPNMIYTAIIYLLLCIVGCLVTLPCGRKKIRFTVGSLSMLASLCMVLFVFFNSSVTLALGIEPDMWLQDRYYRYNGVMSGFLTNVPLLDIEKPTGYNEETVNRIADGVADDETAPNEVPPDIIFLMAEGFWDMEELPGIVYDRELMPNFNRLAEEAASGWAYSPSYGGGTCDVEFEALTGFSMEFLPSGSKPYQQYINSDIFSLPWVLKEDGYETLAIHGYGELFWNRDVAYPRLGIDTFISEEDMQGADRRRGFISDMAMVDRIITEQQNRSSDDNPLFIHAITIQNHTTYYPTAYPEDEMVNIIENDVGLSQDIIGQLEDCATGISEMDAALGHLTDYLLTVERPTIVVFWGDHLNPMSDGYGVFEDTGFIELGDSSHPDLFKLPLLIWSNTEKETIDLGVLSTYNISPVMMDIYDLDTPTFFDFLIEQLDDYTASSNGVMYFPNGNYTRQRTAEQEDMLYEHSILQYDLMFGEKYLEKNYS